MVWAEDPETGERALKRVVRTFLNEKDELVHVQINGETITCTTEYPFYVQGKGWVAAKDLKPNYRLVLKDGKCAVVETIQLEQLAEPIEVYNFEVEDFHTYYVGIDCVLVHNMCQKPNDVAKRLGYRKTKELCHRQAVYYNSKASRNLRYITKDYDSHNGGYWKAADSVENLGRKETRSGTYDINLNWMKK